MSAAATHRPVRIALVTDGFDPITGGLETWAHQFVEWLIAAGYAVEVVTFHAAAAAPARVHVLPWSRSPLQRAAQVARCLQTIRADIVHDLGTGERADVFHPQTGSRRASVDRDLLARPRMRRWRSTLSPAFQRWRREIDVLEQKQCANARSIIAVSNLVKHDLQRRFALPQGAVEVIRNGVDTHTFRPAAAPQERVQCRARFGLAEEVMFVLVAANFGLKGVGTVLRALTRLDAERSRVRVLIVGTHDLSRYTREAQRLRVGPAVRFLGWVDDIGAVYRAADVSLQPSYYDACSLSTLEALASGLPLITTAWNGAAEVIEPGVHGLILHDPADANGLASAMLELLDPVQRTRMASAVRELAPACDRRRSYAAIETIYQRHLAGAAQTRGAR